MAKKEYTIEVTGRYFVAVREYPTDVAKEQATKSIADMLRYDKGRVLYLDVVKENRSFTAIVRCQNYTKGRWDSFGIRTREVNYEAYLNKEVEIEWNV
jgi:hypothetical protein